MADHSSGVPIDFIPIQVMLLGDSQVGKSCLGLALAKGWLPSAHAQPNFVVETCYLNVNGDDYQLNLWDTNSSAEYASLRPSFYPGTHVVLILYQVSNLDSFNKVRSKWLPEMCEHMPKVPWILVGAQNDLKEEISHSSDSGHPQPSPPVKDTQARTLATKNRADALCLVSASRGEGIRELANQIVASFIKSHVVVKKYDICNLS